MAVAAPPAPTTMEKEQEKAPAARVRLDYLDGLRGLAALFVVLHHAYAELEHRFPHGEGISSFLWKPLKFLSWGHFTVDIFIVLSGYCLMLPVVKSLDGRLRGGFMEYIKRRAKRILPPYYAALAFCLALIALIPNLRYATSPNWDYPLQAFTPGILLSHLFLFHNLSTGWIHRIDHPMWSVATEWQIYFVFPLLLLPLWRRFGMAALLIVSTAIGTAIHFLFPSVDLACFWYIGLFAMGMAAAAIGFSPDPKMARLRGKSYWWLLALLPCAALFTYAMMNGAKLDKGMRWLTDPIVGLSAAALLVYCTRFRTGDAAGPAPWLLRLFELRPVVALGVFSYSLYLIHYPLFGLTNTIMRTYGVPPTANFLISFLVVAPLAIGLSYLFHLVFERPFMPGHPSSTKKAAKAAVTSPAP